MALASLRASPLVEQATAHLREQITNGHWPIGTKLPAETALATTLGVGRSTVREALRALSGAGLVRTRQGAGVFVIADRPDEDWPARLRRAVLTDVHEVRSMLEVQAIRLAAVRRTPEDLVVLDAALAVRAAVAPIGGPEFIDADLALHTALVAAAHNPVLTDLYAEFAPRLRAGLLDLIGLMDVRAHDADHGAAAHAALVAAIRDGDADTAAEVLRSELLATQARLTTGTAAGGTADEAR